ncbi:13098_t:CDS:2, partial [Funneliformis geosporum]
MPQKCKQVVKKSKTKAKIPKRTRTSYSIEQKEVVVNYAKKFRRNNAAVYFKLNKSMVGRWVRASKKWIDNVSRNSKRVVQYLSNMTDGEFIICGVTIMGDQKTL